MPRNSCLLKRQHFIISFYAWPVGLVWSSESDRRSKFESIVSLVLSELNDIRIHLVLAGCGPDSCRRSWRAHEVMNLLASLLSSLLLATEYNVNAVLNQD
jgi:hypothetical protein